MLLCTCKYQAQLDGYKLWIKYINNYLLWINGLQCVDIMDKFVELHLYIVTPMDAVDDSSPRV